MKVNIEIDSNIDEDIVIIKCKEINHQINKIQQFILQQNNNLETLAFYKDNTIFYFPINDVLFFEVFDDSVFAHLSNDTYKVKLRLYELEKLLPSHFTRIAKSAIINVKHIYSIERNLTSSSLIKFHKSHKQVYVSRLYYKKLKQKIDERMNHYES